MSLFSFVNIRKFQSFALACGCVLLLVGCGPARFGADDEPTPTPTWEPVATFTPTTPPLTTDTPVAAPATPAPVAIEPTVPALTDSIPPATVPAVTLVTPESAIILTPTVAASDNAIVTTTSDAAEVESTPTSLPGLIPTTEPAAAHLVVTTDAANVRSGPGTNYPQIGVVTRDATFAATGRNEVGDWWQFCCVNEQSGWVFATLVTVQNAELVAVVAAPAPPPTPEPVAQAAPEEAVAPTETSPPAAESAPAEEAAPAPTGPGEHSGTAGNFDPNTQYQIVHYRVLGFDDNNGGIFNKGAQQFIFLTVLDENGNGVNGAVVKDAVGDKLNIVTGEKGPGKSEIKMDWDPYKLYVASDPSGLVTSQVSNQMNNPYPHIPDIIGLLGPPENEYAICPTADDRCTPPFYHAHWSYEITFQKVK